MCTFHNVLLTSFRAIAMVLLLILITATLQSSSQLYAQSPTITCPDNITVSSSTGFIYVGERGGSVSKISTSGTRTVLAGVSSADGVVFDSYNSILVSRFNGVGTTIVRVDRTSGAQTNIASLAGATQGMSVDGLGNAYVANEGLKKIQKINLSTNAISDVVTLLNQPIDVIVESPTKLLISEFSLGSIIRRDLSTNTSSTLVSGLNTPTDIFRESATTILVAEYGGGRITRVNLTSGVKTTVATLGGGPHGIARDMSGNLYVTQYNLGRIAMITPSLIVSAFATGLSSPVFIELSNGPGLSGTDVVFSSSVTGTPAPTVTYSHASGSFFPIGTTEVNATATNNSGSASCSFTVTVTPLGIAPTLTCPANIVTNNNPGTGGAVVNYTVTSTGDPAPSVTCTPASGSVFPIGTTTVNCTATNANGSVSCSFTVTVIDNEPPSITCSVNPASLWPPNHKMKDISASFTASDNSGTATVVLTSITCSEPDNGLGDGDTPDDIQDASYGTADTQFKLRAERSGRGNGRVYTITYSATDASGNSSTCVSTVTVPHNPGSKTEIGPEEMSKAPEEFALHGNYPNPFNPSTVISYSLPVNGVVTLKVFNTLGEEVATLLNNEELESGNYEAIFTAESLPSGIYFYRINVESVDEDGVKNSFTDVKRLTLLK